MNATIVSVLLGVFLLGVLLVVLAGEGAVSTTTPSAGGAGLTCTASTPRA